MSKTVLPKSVAGRRAAVRKRLMRLLDYPELELSTNLTENCMRPIAVHRANWIHIGSEQADRACRHPLSGGKLPTTQDPNPQLPRRNPSRPRKRISSPQRRNDPCGLACKAAIVITMRFGLILTFKAVWNKQAACLAMCAVRRVCLPKKSRFGAGKRADFRFDSA